MGPALTNVCNLGVKPLVANAITADKAFNRAIVLLRAFMEKNARNKDLRLFIDMSGEKPPDKPEELRCCRRLSSYDRWTPDRHLIKGIYATAVEIC